MRLTACTWVLALLTSPVLAQTVFINELHYDHAGADSGEAVEVAGAAGTDLAGWTLIRYNGNGGRSYGTSTLSGTIPDLCGGFGVIVVQFPPNGLQNGSPDGLALVDDIGTVVQFLSYQGTFTAVDGPAQGLTSTDIGVAESNEVPAGHSLQLTGSGSSYEDFRWNDPAPSTFGACNAVSQVFTPGGAAPALQPPTPSPETAMTELLDVACDGADLQLLDKQFFFVCHNNNLRLPAWVAYQFNAATLAGTTGRTDDYREDDDLAPEHRARLDDYRGSGFDRGHMAPAAAFKRSREAMSTTFLLSNMAPQRVTRDHVSYGAGQVVSGELVYFDNGAGL